LLTRWPIRPSLLGNWPSQPKWRLYRAQMPGPAALVTPLVFG
jgi:hypothetical protein